jgi:hypothetical protein
VGHRGDLMPRGDLRVVGIERGAMSDPQVRNGSLSRKADKTKTNT